MRISERLLTLVVLCLLVAAIPAFASGRGERELKQARGFVEQRLYSKAMSLLLEIMKDYPDLREQADKLVTRIMDVRRQFNALYAELVAAVDRKDVAKGLEIIKKLRELDPDPDPAILNAIRIAEQRLVWAGRYSEFEAVMIAARKQLDDGKTADAIMTYVGGFSLGQPEFNAAGYPEIQRQQAVGVVGELQRISLQAAGAEAAARAVPDALAAILAKPVTDSDVNTFGTSLAALAAARDREIQIRTLATRLGEINRALLDAKLIATPDIWLSFVEQYALGRPGEPPEGLATAVRRPWIEAARRLSDASYAATETAYQEADKLATGDVDLGAFGRLAAEARRRGLLALAALAAERTAWQPVEGLSLTDADRARDAELAERAASVRQRMAEADSLEKYLVEETAARQVLSGLLSRLEAVISAVSPAAAPSADELAGGRKVLADIITSVGEGEKEWAAAAAVAPAGSTRAARAAGVLDSYAAAGARARQADGGAAVQIAGIEQRRFEPRLATAESLKLQGQDRASRQRPDEAVKIFDEARAEAGGLRSAIEDWSARWKADRAGELVERSYGAAVADQRTRLEQLQAEIEAYRGQARAALDDAVDLARKGDEALGAARALVRAKKFRDALPMYEAARTNYDASLKLLENEEVRKRSDSIAAEIVTADREASKLAYAEASALIAQGIDEYTGGDPRKAVATFEAAKERWDSVSKEQKNETLEYYLALARSALTEKGRQTLDPTDPMYEDVRGFMTQAYVSYNAASKLVKTPPPSEEAQRYIDAAAASLKPITTAVPEYLEARILSMKIKRLTLGPAGFAADLRDRVPRAIAILRNVQAPAEARKNAYLELVDYRSFEEARQILNPTVFKQMTDAIDAYEVATGIKEREPTAAEIQEGTRLYNEANARFQAARNDKSWYDWILNKCAESLARYRPRNPALTLQGTVAGLRGGAQQVMSYAHIAEYQEALRLAARGDKPRARVVIQRLLGIYPGNPVLIEFWNQIK